MLAVPPGAASTGIVTARAAGAESMTASCAAAPPSTAVAAAVANRTVSSLSARVTVAKEFLPARTPAPDRSPNLTVTLSPSSLSVSSVAVTVKAFSVSPAANVTLAGIAEWSAAVAPPSREKVSGMVTTPFCAGSNWTVTCAPAPPSVAV